MSKSQQKPAPKGWGSVETASDGDTSRGRGAPKMPPKAEPYVPKGRRR